MSEQKLGFLTQGLNVSLGWVLTFIAGGVLALGLIVAQILSDQPTNFTIFTILYLGAALCFTAAVVLALLRVRYRRAQVSPQALMEDSSAPATHGLKPEVSGQGQSPVAPVDLAQGYGWAKASDLSRVDEN
jgi:hypothetical protein